VATTATDHGLLIGGERVETGEWTDVRSPFSGELVGRVARGGGLDGPEISVKLSALHPRYEPLQAGRCVPALIAALKTEGAGDILVVCGGVIPRQDYDFLKKAGVSAIFGPGTNIPAAAAEIVSLIRKHRLAA